nr:hypothetical protein [Nocardioides humi]
MSSRWIASPYVAITTSGSAAVTIGSRWRNSRLSRPPSCPTASATRSSRCSPVRRGASGATYVSAVWRTISSRTWSWWAAWASAT